MSSLVSRQNDAGLFKIELEEDAHGVKVLVWETAASIFPERDFLDSSIAEAKERCREDYAVPDDSWVTA